MKFAYLIMAHDNPNQLNKLLSQLDWPGNDIYLHLDKKSTCFNLIGIKQMLKKAEIHVFQKFHVYWGDTSQMKCQIYLLSKAHKRYHDYYHLLSGKDFPLKPHEEIVQFFNDHHGEQFVHFQSLSPSLKKASSHYYIFHSFITRIKNTRAKTLLIRFQHWAIEAQQYAHIKPRVFTGANWYSITHELAADFLKHKTRAFFRVAFIKNSDEYVLQTFIMDHGLDRYAFHSLQEDSYEANVRAIDWTRGQPYIWKNGDYDQLIQMGRIWGRKFDETVDDIIIERLIQHNRNTVMPDIM